tara:strand:+ start:212 stop:1342 length:1131 start_codon:yes stop_codon:yes gene_type:complete
MISSCKLCNGKRFKIILNKKKTKIFTNAEDAKNSSSKIKCILLQCRDCNFVFQKNNTNLNKNLSKIYKSKNSQLSRPLGEGNWGKERFLYLKSKIKNINYFKNKKILELACGNGYLLRYLSKKSFNYLYGIDPSLNNKIINNKKIVFLNKFVDKKLKINQNFDLIFSIGLYEHAKNINEITEFSISHLSDKGKILVILPNFQQSLTKGNPDLFAHEHINYFTLRTMIKHFRKYNFIVEKNYSDKHAIALYFTRSKREFKVIENKNKFIKYEYSKKLNYNLSQIKKYICREKVIVHGACNSLNNILSWINNKSNFTLVDNDKEKQNKIFFKRKVYNLDSINLKKFKFVIIIPSFFSKKIKDDYSKKGFNGKFIILNY